MTRLRKITGPAHTPEMTAPRPKRPGDLILDRYLPRADDEQREQARDALRAHARLLMRIGERIAADLTQGGDWADSPGRRRLKPPRP